MATMKDIANETGLGLATISKYLNGGNVRPNNKVLLDNAIKKLDYQVNEYARGLRSKFTKTIGIVIPEIDNIYITSIISDIEKSLRKKGYAIIVCTYQENIALEKEAIDFLVMKMVDGIICMPNSQSGDQFAKAYMNNIPIVLLDREVCTTQNKHSSVLINNVNAGYIATDYLIKNGHEKIAIITGHESIYTAEKRYEGYVRALKENGIEIDPKYVFVSEYTIDGGMKAIQDLIESSCDATAIFVTNYFMTIGAILYINERGIKVPEDYSLLGFDNLFISKIFQPNLTTVEQPMQEIANSAVDIVLECMNSKSPPPCKKVVLDAKLVEGKSVMNLNK